MEAWNPLAEGYADDPWPQYAALVEDGFGHHDLGFFTVWQHAHVSQVLRAGLSVEHENQLESMLERDPPDHTRLRGLVSKAFTPRSVAALEPMVRAITEQALDQLAADGGGDLVPTVSFTIPFQVISQMLGMPDVDTAELRRLSGRVAQSLEPVFDPVEQAAIDAAGAEFEALIEEAIAWKRASPADDMLSALIAAETEGDRLTPTELRDQVLTLYVAGHETTVNLISGGTLALLQHPSQADALRADPSLDANAVEELLRYDSPVHLTNRRTLAEFVLDDVELAPGTEVLCGLAAANRDPRVFGADAAALRLDRPEANQHVSFSSGIHHCLGSALARLEGRTVLPTLFRRFPSLALAGPVTFNGRINLRGPASLPVTV